MSDRPFAYVCSPYRGDVDVNVERARGYCREVFEAGYTPWAPHIYFPRFLNDDIPEEREAGMEMGAALLPQCRVLVVCGNEITEGMAREIKRTEQLRIPILTLDSLLPEAARECPPAATDEKRMLAAQQEAAPLSPAQMALSEPGIFDEDIDCVDTSTYMSMLTDRVNAKFIEYIDGLRDKHEITDYSAEIATIAEAHYYITQRYNFHFSELDYLLQFQNPLMVVTEAFDANRDEEHSDIMWKIFHEQRAFQNGRHALASYTSDEPAAKEKERGPAEKESVIKRIRAAEKTPKQPRKDKPTRDKSGPEL